MRGSICYQNYKEFSVGFVRAFVKLLQEFRLKFNLWDVLFQFVSFKVFDLGFSDWVTYKVHDFGNVKELRMNQ